ncbi:MAG TPA: hypothetical protein VF021_03710 [Longimicrobiales bacterium]
MAETTEKVPLGQRLYDRPFLLMVLGILIMLACYTLWGVWEVLSLPQSTLP